MPAILCAHDDCANQITYSVAEGVAVHPETVVAIAADFGWTHDFANSEHHCPDHPITERVTLEGCECGNCYDCPDGWHYGTDLPCSCTPDCILDRNAPAK